MADNDNRYRLWQTISKEYDLPDYNQFSKDMEDATKRKSLHDAVAAEYELPDFDQFSKDMGYEAQTTQQGNQNAQNAKNPQQTAQSSHVEEGRGLSSDNGYSKQKTAFDKAAEQAWNKLAHKGGIKWTIKGHPEVKMVAVTDDLVKRFPQLEQSRGYQVPFNMSTGTPIMQNIDDKGNIITPDEASEQYTKILTNQDFDYVPKQETAAVQIGSVVNTALSTKGGWLDRAVQKAMEESYGKDWKNRKYVSDGKEISSSEIYAKAKQGIYDNINGVLGDIRKSLLFSTDEQRRQTVDELYQKGYLKEDFLPKANALHYISNVDKDEQVEEIRQRILKLQVQREMVMDKLNQIPQPDHAENMAEFYARRAIDGSELYASDLRKIDKQIAQYKAVIDELEGKNNLKNEWGHAVQTSGITDIGAWDFGVTDLKDAMMMYPLAKKMQNGENITQDDFMSLKLLAQANEADAVENAVMPSSYNMFKGSLQSVPFTVQFGAGKTFAEGTASVVNKAATRAVKGAILKAGGKKALRAAEKVAEKAADSKILKFCGMLGKDFEKAFVMENTTSAATTGAEILNRHIGTVTESDDGFKMEGESLPTAIIKGEISQNIESQTEFLGEHFPSSLKFIRGMAHTKVGSAMGLRNLAAWLTKVSRTEFATTLKSYATRAGIDGVFGEYLEEVAGTAENALLVGDQKFSDLLDVKQQEEVAGSVVLSCLGMGIFGTAIYSGQRGLNMPTYYRLQHLQNKWDNAGLDLFTGEEWAKWKDRIDNTPNEGMKFVMADILKADNMTEEQARAAFNYARCSLTLRGMNIGAMKAAQLGLTDDRHIEQDNAYVEGRQAKDEDKHDIQIEFEDRSHELAEKLGISEQQLDNMSDEDLESLTGKDDQLDNLIYDYQTSHAKYQGVVDNADDEIDKAAQEAARQTDMATDKSRGTVRNATIKAAKGEEDYGVYIVSGNVATNEDGSINVSESDDMILYYDPKSGKIEHCDAMRLAALGEEVNAEDTRNQAIADAKEKAIRKQAGIIDGTVGEGTTFTITDAEGNEHTYEVLADNGDGSAMITMDGNVQDTPVSLQDLQNLKDAEDAKNLEAAKMQRQQYEEEREKQNAPVEDNLDYADIINTNGNVEIAEVVDEEGNAMFPNAEEVFFVQNQGNRAKVMVLDSEGNLQPKLVKKSSVRTLGTMSVDEYRQGRQQTLKEAENESEPSLVDETETSNNVVPTDNVTTDNTTTDETQPGNEAEVTTSNETQNISNEQENTPKITLEDGTEVPMLEDGNPDFSQLTAGQVAELYDTQFGEDAGQIISNNVDRSKKALNKANAMTVSGGSFVEQKASKEAKDKAIAEAKAKYDSAKAIEDAYNERMLAKEEDTPEGRQNLIEKARRKFNRMKGSVKDNAQAIAQLYNETVGALLHRLYDSTGIDVFDDTANTVDEYVASSIAPYSLNYEGTETSKGVKQETGLSRSDFAKTGLLAKEGKGKTIGQLANDLWRDRPSNLENITDQDVRNAIIDLITSGQTAFGLKNHIQNLRIAEAENILEQQKRQADELAHAEKQKEEELASTEQADNNTEDSSNADVAPAEEQAEDNKSDLPFDAPSPDENSPFSAKDKAKDPLEVWNNMTDEEKAAYIEQNRVKDTRLVDDVVGKKLRKAIEKIAEMMGATVQWQRTDMIRNGWFNPNTKTIYLALDSSVLWGVQFVFGHEVTHDIKTKSPAMYEELKGLVKEKYGEEKFEAMTNKNEKRYASVGKTGNDRSYYEEETVADAIGATIRDLNLTRSLALKMSHPLLAKMHDVLLKVKNALMATPYTDDVKGIIRTIEQVYVKTANGTFESSASEGTNDEQFGVRDANERFNNEIENFKNKSHKGLLHLGTPSPILKACGVDVDEITLSPKVLNRKLNQHSLTTEDVKDLVNAIQRPIMVYKHGEEAPNIVVITNADIRGNKLSLSLELDANGNVTKLNNVSSIHDKDAETEINRWLSWDEGYLEKALRWVDKEKVSDWLSSARLNSYSQTENNQKLSSIAKILNDFENPNISEENISNDDENVSYSLRQKPEPEKKGIGYKVFVLGKDGKLYPPMVANPNGAATPVGVWLDADAAPIAGESKTGRPQVKQGGKGTQGGSGKLAYRPGWHLGVIPYAIQFNRKDAEGNKTLFPKNFVFAEVEYAADKDYQDEAHAEGINGNGKYQHSLAGLKHLPTDGYYMYRTNPNPETDPRVITGAMKVNRLLTRAEQADIVKKAGREPQQIQEGDIVTDDVVNSINQEIAAAPKFSLKVYHGTGTDFTEFDFDHMSEGAGDQLFGWGGYVTSSEEIGRSYAYLSGVGNPNTDVKYIGENAEAMPDFIPQLFIGGSKTYDDVRKRLQDIYEREKTPYRKDILDWFESTNPSEWIDQNEGNRSLYEVNIPDDNGNNYLDYYAEAKPELKETILKRIKEGVSPEVKALPRYKEVELEYRDDSENTIPLEDEMVNDAIEAYDRSKTVGEYYDALCFIMPPQFASEYLSSLGYTGFRYPAGTLMGGAKEGDVNYVIFKPEDMQIVEHEKFSVKSNVDNQGNPLNQDGTLKLDKIKSVDELTDEDFTNATRNVQLPPVPQNMDAAIGANGKPVIIKKNIFEKNWNAHKFTPAESRKVLSEALYNTDLVGRSQPTKKPNHWVAIKLDEKSPITVLEVNDNKDNVEVVGWYTLDERNLGRIKRQAERNGGELIMLSLNDKVESLSTPSLNSAANVANSSGTSKGNAGKFSLRLQDAINETDTEPTEAQKKSGNYKKGHVKFGGYDYTIENPKGSYRSGVDENGKEWKQKMNDTYGYIRGKFGKDGDHLDMFINDKADLDSWNGDVFVVDQVNPDGTFDEHKVMYGYDSLDDAKKAYLSNYEKGWTGLGNITPVSKAGFDKWLDKSNRKLKPFADYADITSKTDMDTAPSSFEEFLEHPAVRYSIRNEKERAAAEDAYNFAQENRPDRYSRYAIVNMEKPGAVPQYLEKKTVADNWRRYYNKLKWGNYKLFDLDKPFEDNVKNLVGKFPETFRQGNEEKYSLIGKKGAEALENNDDYNLYRKLGGEVEARNVQSRMGMSPEERRKTLAEETEDVARKDQIFLYGGSVSMMGSRAFNEAINSSDNIRFSLKEEKEKIVSDAKANGTYMTAPNGEKTKLNAEQWVTVRTTNFKNWFGDWENDPEKASKVVDENGEPMVVWHGRSAEFNTFEKKEGVRFIMGLEDKVKAEGFFFSPNKGLAEEFASNSSRHRGGKANVIPCFLNIRKPMDLTKEDYDRIYEDVTGWDYIVGMDTQDNLWGIMDEEGMADKIKEKGYDGAIFVEEVDDSYEPTKISYCALDANQIKSADNNNGGFSTENDDIRYSLKDVDRKQAQLDIILKTNPMLDDYHTGIRKVEDIKTLEESVEEARSEAEKYGDDEWSAYPDITNDMLQNALETGEITIYSSKPIKNGVFVTPSYMQASDYAGGGNVYEKTVPLTDVAWINTDEGQYAKVDGERYSLKEVNDKFNDRLAQLIENPNQKDRVLHLGRSSQFLIDGGIADAEIELDFDKFVRKSSEKYKNNHPFSAGDIKDLPKAIAHPVAVFNSTTKKDHVVMTELNHDGKNFIVAIRATEQNRKNKVVLEVNQITSLYPKGERGIIYWIKNNKLSNVDKEKALHFIEALQPHAGTLTSEELSFAANIVRNFVNPKQNDGNLQKTEKYSLRVDRYRDELNQWKKDNNLPKDAERPQLPVREPNESAADFLKRVKEYRKQAALWATAPTYEDHLLVSDTAQGQFNLEMQRKAVLTRIVIQDSMLAIRKAQEAIMKEKGVDKLNPAEDAYTAENRSHGKAKNEFEEYNDEFLQPLRKAYNELMLRLGKSYDNVKVYMIAKHGLERNAHIAFKYALDEDFETNEERMDAYNNYKSDMDRLNNDADFEAGRIDFATWKQRDGNIRTKYAPSYFKFRFDENGITKDYSGLSALFDADDYEGAAADLVKDVEDANPYFTDELWYATNDATKKILRDSYNAGMMTEDNFNFVSGMYRNYIPLRGWGDTNADQVWNYVGGGKGAFSQVVKEAKGRKSLADDPIAYIENMAESAILMNNRNWVKQHLLLLAQNHRTSLLHVSKAWYIKTKDAQGNEEWIPASPQITEGMTGRQVELALEAFEQKMEQMKQNGEATQKREHLEISYPQTNGEEREHEVRVMKGGEEYVIYVNGDPQLAQAVNNTRARKVREGIAESRPLRILARIGRYMSAAYTSRSPLFIPANYMRDLTMALSSTAIREDARYNYLLRRNMLRHWNTFPMVLSYQNGTLREKVRNGSASEVEKMFYDFMMNGGETGFVTSVDVEDLKKKFRNDLKDLNRMAANPKKVGHIIMDSIETLNRAIEDSNRFMVYMTSIQYGRSIEEAVNNAKDVTLNFNRKGTGEHGWQAIRDMYLFINPAVQSLQTLGALAKHHPFKFTAVTTGWLATGLLVPMLNNLLMSFFGGDDDKDKYWQFTKWDRRNNFIMWIPFTKEFVKIPLAQEFRGFYGVGDMIASKLWGGEKAEESWGDYALDLAGQIVDMLPLDPTGYDGNIGLALTPNAARPIGELALNVDFTGKPIFKNSEYNKYDPNFTKAYVGTPDWLVRISKMVNSIDNKYPDVEQNAIDRFGDPRFNLNNPAVVDHVLSSYLGGAYTMGSQILGVATKALNGDDIKMADIPLASKFVSNPDDRPVSKKQGEEFWDMKERHDRAANTLSKLKQKAKVDGDYSTLDIFFGSDEYRQYKEDDKKVKKYEEDRKKEKAQETGEEYKPHKTTADDVYKSHTTPKDDFEDMKMKQLYEKLNSYKIRYEAIDGISSEKGDAYYKANKAAIDAIEEIAYDKSQIASIKKGFLSDGQNTYDADGMKDIREMRKRILDVLEKANKTMMNNRK